MAAQPLGWQRVFTADIDGSPVAAGRERGDRHRFDDSERILFHQHAILERAWLRFVRVADQVVRARGRARDRVPFTPGRKERAAATDQPGVRHFADDGVPAHL
jgi:hypothetical protein